MLSMFKWIDKLTNSIKYMMILKIPKLHLKGIYFVIKGLKTFEIFR